MVVLGNLRAGGVRAGSVPVPIAKAASVVLGLSALIAVGSLVYGLTLLSVNQVWAITVCIGSGLLLGAIVLAFVKGGEWQVNLGLMIGSTGASLFAVNLLLMAVTPTRAVDSVQAAIRTGAKFDTRTTFEVVRDLRQGGVHAYPTSPTNWLLGEPELQEDFARLLPLGGVSRSSTVLCNEGGAYTIYESDRYGFNNDDTVHDAPGGLDMLLVGDSYAHGACVAPGQDVAGRLRNLGSDAATVGNEGNGPLLELASLVEYGRAWRPPVVLWLYYAGNDFQDLLEEQQRRPLLRYLDGYRQNLVGRQAEVDSLLDRIFEAEYVRRVSKAATERVEDAREKMTSLKSRLKQAVTLYELRRRLSIDREAWGEGFESSLPLFEQILREAQANVRSWGGRLYVVYLPDWATFAQRPAASRDAVLSVFQRLRLPVIDFETRLRQTPDPLDYFPFRLPNHYTAEGYALLAKQIQQALK